jgi:hypothetical protein
MEVFIFLVFFPTLLVHGAAVPVTVRCSVFAAFANHNKMSVTVLAYDWRVVVIFPPVAAFAIAIDWRWRLRWHMPAVAVVVWPAEET